MYRPSRIQEGPLVIFLSAMIPWVLAVNVGLGASVVINEILYEPANPAISDRFIELYNPGPSVVNLSGWVLYGSVGFQFPSYTVIQPGGYLVVAEDPQTLRARSGSICLGPLVGTIPSDGLLVLLDAAGNVVDQVRYGLGLPWPTETAGRSIELINPNLDNAKGGAWRAYRYGTGPANGASLAATPGARNSVWQANAPPVVEAVDCTPAQPTSGRPLVITARISDQDGIGSVTLRYQAVHTGAYIPAWLPVPVAELVADPCSQMQPNPAFEDPSNWVQVPMVDDGTGVDQVAGDGVFSAVIPGQPNRTLVRYRITAIDASSQAVAVTIPHADDAALNLACWVYDGLPDYLADMFSALGTPHRYTANRLQTVPVYFMVTRAQDLAACLAYDKQDQIPANSPAQDAFNWECAFVYEGRVYDHVRYRLDGDQPRYHASGKPDVAIRFNRGNWFVAKDLYGNPYGRPWQVLRIDGMLDSLSDPPGYGQGDVGLPRVVNWILWDRLGLPCPRSHWVHMRVVTGAQEAPEQYHGDFWGLFLATEPFDGSLLAREGLPQGDMYKISTCGPNSQVEVIYRADGSDYRDLSSMLDLGSALYGRSDQDSLLWYHVLVEAVRWPQDRFVVYLQPDPSSQLPYKFWLLPDRTDLSWGPWSSCDHGPWSVLTSVPSAMGIEYRNRIRQLRDLIWEPNVIGPLLDGLASVIEDISLADLDRWSNVPRSSTNPGTSQGLGWSASDKAADMKAFAFVGGRDWPSPDGSGYVAPGGQASVLEMLSDQTEDMGLVPPRPTVEYIGPEGFPVDQLRFSIVQFKDKHSPNIPWAVQWRIARSPQQDLPLAEWDAIWTSPPLLSMDPVLIPTEGLMVGRSYRVRARFVDDAGRCGHWSLPVQFLVGPGIDQTLAQGLRITEIMYHPPDGDAEFLELSNIGSETLDLSGVRITGAVEYTFGQVGLEPGQFILLVKERVIFEQVYGPGLPVVGQYAGRLDNAGESIIVLDRFGYAILTVSYDPAWYPQTDGQGLSLVASDPSLEPGPDWSTPEAWALSSGLGGSPGQDQIGELPLPGTVIINEVLAHSHADASDWIEIHNRGDRQIDLSGWFLSDSGSDLTKYQIPSGTVIPAGGYLVFYEKSQFGNPSAPGCRMAFALSEAGEKVYLSSGRSGMLTGYQYSVEFGPSETGISFGTYQRSDGQLDFVYQGRPTPGARNAYPLVGPVVINEIMYNPAGNPDAEYVELLNCGKDPVRLYDAASGLGWRFSDSPDDPGIVLVIKDQKDVTIRPGEYVLLVRDKDVFAAFYKDKVPVLTEVFQWTGGRLNNAGECIQLAKAIYIDGQTIGWVLVDQVIYSDGSHPPGTDRWPSGADGGGLALARIDPNGYGNDPINWKAAEPSPGRPNP
ncbi:MAG: lamin tail domain-containing protein [Sedimentisphaerales bacterium]|nr:lamin tail domain-containing protein [Sedimentisphaerales bacterium]